MRLAGSRCVLLVAHFLLLVFAFACGPEVVEEAGKASVKVQLEGARETVELVRAPDGSLRFLLVRHGGGADALTPEQFAERVYGEQAGRGFWFRLFNITSVWGLAWVALGLAGQLIFAGRMMVQWIASEKERRSVVPISFWWMSVVGSTMLIVYFVWRQDIVGVLGQSTGWAIYLRNLWMIRRAGRGER